MDSIRPKTISQLKSELECADRQTFEALRRALSADDRKGVKSLLESTQRRLEAEGAESQRLSSLYAVQAEFSSGGFAVGLDEVGRGPVAGPLTVGAVVLPDTPRISGLNDSKQLSESARKTIARQVKDVALAWHIEHIPADCIDAEGMSACLRLAFSRALAAVDAQMASQERNVSAVLIDGNPLRIDERERNIVKGDAKCACIAAASVIAKVERDRIMCELSDEYPQYGFDRSKGYASAEHIEAIRRYGLSPVHRATFCQGFCQDSLF